MDWAWASGAATAARSAASGARIRRTGRRLRRRRIMGGLPGLAGGGGRLRVRVLEELKEACGRVLGLEAFEALQGLQEGRIGGGRLVGGGAADALGVAFGRLVGGFVAGGG